MAFAFPFIGDKMVEAGYEELAWKIILVLLCVFAFYSSMIKLLVFGFVSQFDASTNFIALFMLGCATNGFVVLVLQVIVLLFMYRNDVVKAAYVYFFAAGTLLIICQLLFLNLFRYKIITDKTNPTEEVEMIFDNNFSTNLNSKKMKQMPGAKKSVL